MSNRRKFLLQSSALVGGAALASAFEKPGFNILKSKFSPADQVNIGAIGINGMGWADTSAALKVPGVNLVAVCDIDKNVIDKRLKDLSKWNVDASKVTTY